MAHIIAFADFFAVFAGAVPVDQPAALEAFGLDIGEQGVVDQAEVRHRGVPQPLFGDKGSAKQAPFAGAKASDGLPVHVDRAGVRRQRLTGQHGVERFLPVPGNPGHADDLAAANL